MLRERCTYDLDLFTQTFFPTIDRHKFKTNWHAGLLCEVLHAVELGQVRFLVINMPPRHQKSITLSVMYPAWVWVRKPWEKFIFGTYTKELAWELAEKSRDVIKSDLYQKFFGHIYQIRSDANKLDRFRTTEGGTRFSTSVAGSVTGMGGDKVVIDDPHDPHKAQSDLMRQKAVDWYEDNMYSRVEDYTTAVRIVCGQRVALRDLSGWIKDRGTYTEVSLPGLFNPAQRSQIFLPTVPDDPQKRDHHLDPGDAITIADVRPRSAVIDEAARFGGRWAYRVEGSQWWYTATGERFYWRDPRTEKDEALWESHIPQRELLLVRKNKPRTFSAQYQQNPLPPESAMFQSSDWTRVPRSQLPADLEHVIFIDLASTKPKPGKNPDYTALAHCGKSKSTRQKYLIEMAVTQDSARNVIKWAKRFVRRAGYNVPVFIEQEPGSNSAYAIEHWQAQLDGWKVEGVRTTRQSKAERAQPVADEAGRGDWFVVDDSDLPEARRWIDRFFGWLEVFPEGDHDDEIDAVSGASAALDRRSRKGAVGLSQDHHIIRTSETINYFGDRFRGEHGRFVPVEGWNVTCGIYYDERSSEPGSAVYVAIPPERDALSDSLFCIGEVTLPAGGAPVDILRRLQQFDAPFRDRVSLAVLPPWAVKLQEAWSHLYGFDAATWEKDPSAGLGPLREYIRIDEELPHPIFQHVYGRPRFYCVVAPNQAERYRNEAGLLNVRQGLELYYLNDDEREAADAKDFPALRALLGIASVWYGHQEGRSEYEQMVDGLPPSVHPEQTALVVPGYDQHIARAIHRKIAEEEFEADAQTDFTLTRR